MNRPLKRNETAKFTPQKVLPGSHNTEPKMKEPLSRRDMERIAAERQTHCYTCGGSLGLVTYECSMCSERQCSEACRAKHIKDMDRTEPK
jgi:hypothetical protein